MIFFIRNSMINEERTIIDLKKKKIIPSGKFILYVIQIMTSKNDNDIMSQESSNSIVLLDSQIAIYNIM